MKSDLARLSLRRSAHRCRPSLGCPQVLWRRWLLLPHAVSLEPAPYWRAAGGLIR